MKEVKKELNSEKHKTSRLYRESFKIGIILDLVTGLESDSFIARKYGLSSGFISGLKKISLEQQGYFRILEEMKNQDQSNGTKDLSAENEKLKKALELSMLKVAALETLIEVAEDQLNVDIRKKDGSKQSK